MTARSSTNYVLSAGAQDDSSGSNDGVSSRTIITIAKAEEKAWSALVGGISHNFHIQDLVVSPLKELTWKDALAFYVGLNRCGRSVLLLGGGHHHQQHHNSMPPDSIWPHILAKWNRISPGDLLTRSYHHTMSISRIYYCLREQPGLVVSFSNH